MFYAIGSDNGTVSHFVSGMSAEEAQAQAQPGQIVVEYMGSPRSGGLIQSGAVVFPDPTPVEIEAEKWAAIKQQRNALLDEWRWTITLDSPLSNASQQQWLDYLKTLNRLTVDFSTADSVVWPELPVLQY